MNTNFNDYDAAKEIKISKVQEDILWHCLRVGFSVRMIDLYVSDYDTKGRLEKRLANLFKLGLLERNELLDKKHHAFKINTFTGLQVTKLGLAYLKYFGYQAVENKHHTAFTANVDRDYDRAVKMAQRAIERSENMAVEFSKFLNTVPPIVYACNYSFTLKDNNRSVQIWFEHDGVKKLVAEVTQNRHFFYAEESAMTMIAVGWMKQFQTKLEL